MQIHSQHQSPTQKKDASSASSILDASSQNEALQRKADMANNAAQRAEAPRPNNTGMPDNLKAGIESLSGFSMDDVRAHYNSSKPATVQALAYTQGTDIHVAPGQEKHLPHEAWHVAQQMAGRVSPTTNINGMPVNDNAGLEHEADVMGEKAVMQNKGQYPHQTNDISNTTLIQRKVISYDEFIGRLAKALKLKQINNENELKKGAHVILPESYYPTLLEEFKNDYKNEGRDSSHWNNNDYRINGENLERIGQGQTQSKIMVAKEVKVEIDNKEYPFLFGPVIPDSSAKTNSILQTKVKCYCQFENTPFDRKDPYTWIPHSWDFVRYAATGANVGPGSKSSPYSEINDGNRFLPYALGALGGGLFGASLLGIGVGVFGLGGLIGAIATSPWLRDKLGWQRDRRKVLDKNGEEQFISHKNGKFDSEY